MAGRSALCNPNSVLQGGRIPLSKPMTFGGLGAGFLTYGNAPQEPGAKDRSQMQFVLEIGGKVLDSTYAHFVEKINVCESADYCISTIKIVFSNDFLRFTDENFWEQDKPIKLWLGYRGVGLRRRGGLFYSCGPKYVFSKGESGGKPKIILTGYDESFRLGRTEKRRVWRNMTDANIVREIAKEYNWGADVQDTKVLYEHVAQVNESDWKFLDRRARYYGFQIYLENGVLHFHEPRYRNSGIRMIYYKGNESQLNGLTVWQEVLQTAEEVVATQVDPLSKEVFQVASQEIEDEITKQTKKDFKEGTIITSKTISSFQGEQSRLFMFEEGHKQTRSSLQEEVESFSRSTRWLIKGEGQVIGLENLRVRDVVDVIGCGRASGQYYVSNLSSDIASGAFVSNFKITRTWAGGFKGSKVAPKVLDLIQESTVRL